MDKLSSANAGLMAGIASLLVLSAPEVRAQSWTRVSAAVTSSYTSTRYPIVLVHGLTGFDTLAGVLSYWHRIPQSLASGGAQVFVVEVDPVNSNEARGEQLLRLVQEIQAATGAAKVNLIGHSQGGPTVRYVAAVRPDLIASVSSVGGPHKGSVVADALLGVPPFAQPLIASVLNALGQVIDLLSDGVDNHQEDALAVNLSTAQMRAFNQRFPAGVPATACGGGAASVNGVRYYSWSGSSLFTNVFDLSDPLLAASSLPFGLVQNDGLVSTCSSNLGTVIRNNYDMNHLDEVNQFLGLHALFTDPVALFRQHGNRLKNAGL